LLADEPIASLDPESARRVMELLREVNERDGMTVVVSLHQVDMATHYCPRIVALKEGRILFDGPSEDVTSSLLAEVYGSELDASPVATRPRRTPLRLATAAAVVGS
jgi:phosphonate transport system ATP-binding protein